MYGQCTAQASGTAARDLARFCARTDILRLAHQLLETRVVRREPNPSPHPQLAEQGDTWPAGQAHETTNARCHAMGVGSRPYRGESRQRRRPHPKQSAKAEHQPAMPWRQVPGFVTTHLAEHGIGDSTRTALLFLILTSTRSGEVRGYAGPCDQRTTQRKAYSARLTTTKHPISQIQLLAHDFT